MTFNLSKLIIIDHYDSLRNQVDIYTEEQLAKFTDEDVITEAFSYESAEDVVTKEILAESAVREVSDDLGEKISKNPTNPDSFDYESPDVDIHKIINYDPYSKSKYKYASKTVKNEPPPPSTNVHQFLNKIYFLFLFE